MKKIGKSIWQIWIFLIALLVIVMVCVTNFHTLFKESFWANVSPNVLEQEPFRAMQFTEGGLEKMERIAREGGLEFFDVAAVIMTRYGFTPSDWEISRVKKENVMEWKEILEGQYSVKYKQIQKAYQAVLADIRYFPVPDSLDREKEQVTFVDTWQEKRTYGGERKHEGTDLMGACYERGTYPIISMTDGVVEQMGWLEKGGWRIGIRAPSGGYFYYAHFHSFAPGLQEGDRIKAGELLGYMGDSGYGKEKGTVGKFPVHLHLGIYLETEQVKERSINPYPILQYAQKYKLKHDY